MNIIKKLIIQVEDENGNIFNSEVEGVYITEILQEYKARPIDIINEYVRDIPIEITIKMLSYGGIGNVRTARDVTPKPKQLPDKKLQLPEHG